MLSQKDQYIASAYEQLQVISQDKEKRLEYEARQKAIRDYNQMMLEAEKRGEKRGEKLGIEQGEIQIERMNKLYSLLIGEKRSEDLERAISDKDFRQQLMEQYGI